MSTASTPETDEWGDPVGPTSTADWSAETEPEAVEKLASLQAEANHKREMRQEKPATEGLVTFVIDRFIAEAPDEHEQADLPGGIAEPTTPPVETRHLLTVHGWPVRYIEPIELTGGEWKAAHALACPVVEEGGILILHGKRGNGKTRLAAEIARAGRFPIDQVKGKGAAGSAPDPRRTPLYRTAMGFFVEVRSTYGKKSETTEKQVIEQLASVGLLVIDELQERGESAFEDRLLTHLIDRRYGAMLPTILIANLTQNELGPALGPSIVDRYAENGRRIEFTWDSYRRRATR